MNIPEYAKRKERTTKDLSTLDTTATKNKTTKGRHHFVNTGISINLSPLLIFDPLRLILSPLK